MDRGGMGGGFLPRLVLVCLLAATAVMPVARPSQAAVLSTPLAAARPLPEQDDNIVVRITSPEPGAQLEGWVTIAGYAYDRRSTDGHGLNERDIQLWLNDVGEPAN